MEKDDTDVNKNHGPKKKTPYQLECLEKYYSDDKYPERTSMEEYASFLNLTYKEVRIWFSERRRKEKRHNEAFNYSAKNIRDDSGVQSCTTATKRELLLKTAVSNDRHIGQKVKRSVLAATPLECTADKKNKISGQRGRHHSEEKEPMSRLQVLFSKDYVLKKIFHKDGPSLGAEFDYLPHNAFAFSTELRDSQSSYSSIEIAKKRKVLELSTSPCEGSESTKKHGIGKGLMTAWRATCPDSQKFPTGIDIVKRCETRKPSSSDVPSHGKLSRVSRGSKKQKPILKENISCKKPQDRRTPARKIPTSHDVSYKSTCLRDCTLALDVSSEQSSNSTALVDDEELELKELQGRSNPLRCSVHLTSNETHNCPLCKDLLPQFPPTYVRMKHIFSTKPWDGSPELAKKLFKVLQFLYSHAVTFVLFPFTLDEFAQAFHDKDSLLLGKIHVAILKLLLMDVESEMTSGSIPRSSKGCRFLGLLRFVREQELDFSFWRESLNPLTWTEILREVLAAAGFGSKKNTSDGGNFNKERNQMTKYGLRPRTLKGELFNILSKQGCAGLKVSELARASQILEIGLPNSTEQLEHLIVSTLSSDITLFEKISCSAYRLRVHPHIKGKEDCQSDTSGLENMDDDSDDASTSINSDHSDESEDNMDSAVSYQRIAKYKARDKRTSQKLTQYPEIDESFSGNPWMLGLVEGEYSNLRIEEKLDILVALVDLVGASSTLRMKEPVKALSAVSNTRGHGSGAKIKKSLKNHQLMSNTLREEDGYNLGASFNVRGTPLDDSSVVLSSSSSLGKGSGHTPGCQSGSSGSKNLQSRVIDEDHPLQSVYLGSDRRYNNYWLFLGPCTAEDPGHRRVYFESSEDGHWEVIDTSQALHCLMSILDSRGIREASLVASLEKREAFLAHSMDDYAAAGLGRRETTQFGSSDSIASSGDGSSPISDIDNFSSELSDSLLVSSGAIVIELEKTIEEKKRKWERLQAFDKWIWHSFYSSLNAVKYSKFSFMESLARCGSCHDLHWRDEKHCKICHTTFEIDFDLEERYAIHVATCRETCNKSDYPKHKVLSSQFQALKAAIHAIEAGMPEAALAVSWTRSVHKLWVKRLRRTSSLPELLQVLADFVGAINEDWLYESSTLCSAPAVDDVIVCFHTMPQTISAVALWMVKLDKLIASHLEKRTDRNATLCMPKQNLMRMKLGQCHASSAVVISKTDPPEIVCKQLHFPVIQIKELSAKSCQLLFLKN